MDNSHAPLDSPPFGWQSFFIGCLKAHMQMHGQITREDWDSALNSVYEFQREQETDIQP